jgi:alpha-L-rhamnosidase
MEWKANWIWKVGPVRQNDFCYFRKTFVITGPVRSAKVYITAHHYFQLFVNGTKVGGYGSPALPSRPT